MTHTIEPNERFAKEIAACAADDLVFLVGSGCSKSLPSGLPTGNELRIAILDWLQHGGLVGRCSDDIRDGLLVALGAESHATGITGLAGIPFEALLDIFQDMFPDEKDCITAFLEENLGNSVSNRIHAFLACCLLDKTPQVSAVITTNQDCLIEDAMSRGSWDQIRVVYQRDPGGAGQEAVLFKVHGSLEDPDSIITTLVAERGLDAWKGDLLSRLVGGKTLVILGYSGYDFDICPALRTHPPRKVYWNSREQCDELSADGKALLASADGTHMFGDAQAFLDRVEQLWHEQGRWASCWDDVRPGVASMPGSSYRVPTTSQLPDERRDLILIRAAVEAGAGTAALQMIEGLDPTLAASAPCHVHSLKARSLFLQEHSRARLRETRREYRRALRRCINSADKAELWLSYFEAARLGLAPSGGTALDVPPLRDWPRWIPAVVASLGRLAMSWMAAYLNLRFAGHLRHHAEPLERARWHRARAYLSLRAAQLWQNVSSGFAKRRATRWLVRPVSALAQRGLGRAHSLFELGDNYFGTLQTDRIRLRVEKSPSRQQLAQARRLRDYYLRLGYLTGWSNSNRDIIDIMLEGGLDEKQRVEALDLGREAQAVSKLVDDKPGVAKAADRVAQLTASSS